MNAARRNSPAPARRSDTRAALAALAIAVAFLALVVAIVVVVVPNVLSCSPPSDKELAQQETFVRGHFADARDLRSGVGDCDDGGRGYVKFTTTLSPAAARDSLLTDPACSSPGEEAGDVAARCLSGKKAVDMYFEVDTRNDTTAGSLEFK